MTRLETTTIFNTTHSLGWLWQHASSFLQYIHTRIYTLTRTHTYTCTHTHILDGLWRHASSLALERFVVMCCTVGGVVALAYSLLMLRYIHVSMYIRSWSCVALLEALWTHFLVEMDWRSTGCTASWCHRLCSIPNLAFQARLRASHHRVLF